jgi:hypothetical protein
VPPPAPSPPPAAPPARGRPQQFSMATPRDRTRSDRGTGARQPSVISVASSAKPESRAPSAASMAATVNYGLSPAASRQSSIATTVRQPSIASTVRQPSPSREPSAAKREPSAASVASNATRSRSRGRPLLPIEEAPSRRETVRKVIEHMQQATATNDAKVKASMRMHLSKFARSVAPQARQAKQAPPKRAKSFDELEAEAEIMEQAVPFGAATQRQKTGPAVPDWQRRFGGRLVR